jgi:hypothetical protein
LPFENEHHNSIRQDSPESGYEIGDTSQFNFLVNIPADGWQNQYAAHERFELALKPRPALRAICQMRTELRLDERLIEHDFTNSIQRYRLNGGVKSGVNQ